jgi:hypothetical protein
MKDNFRCECSDVVGGNLHNIDEAFEGEFLVLLDKYPYNARCNSTVCILDKSCPNLSKFKTQLAETEHLVGVEEVVNEE